MMNRSLQHRLKKLEGRFAPTTKRIHHVIQFVEPDGEVTATLRWENGEQKWWYAPGHEPSNEP